MKKELLQKISMLCCFTLSDKECIKLQGYLLLEDYNSARIYLDKCIEIIEWTFAFDPNDETLISQLKYSNELINLVIELSNINERNKRKKQRIKSSI